MSKEAEAAALERFAPYRTQDSIMRVREVLAARVETHRDSLERESSELVRGQIKELRALLKILTE